jgi:alkyl sulfatase BDS1-like metallo-beta-lactamase superfamily hydrolase
MANVFSEASRTRATLAATLCLILTLGSACTGSEPAPVPPARGHADLKALDAEFEPRVLEVAKGVHVAIGYGLGNSILIEGDGGVVIVDTMESTEAAEPVKAAFSRITANPVLGIIYTHNHADHVFGASVMAGDNSPEIWSHALTLAQLERVTGLLHRSIYQRSMRQFGTFLPEGAHINCGIGPKLAYKEGSGVGLLRPTHTFAGKRQQLDLAGLNLELVHAPGETPDHIFVWMPDQRILFPGDNFYKSFPNLYAIRGTSYRDVMQWVKSIDEMRALRPAILVPSHTQPIVGEEAVYEALTDYRDAIAFVHDQTVRALNLGVSLEDVADQVRLPEHLASKPYLTEYYGRVDWSVRSIFTGYLGWFGGNATDLHPLPTAERGRRMVALLGGRDALLATVEKALSDGEAQWAAELVDFALAEQADDTQAVALKVQALRDLAAEEISANGRNYYLTQAAELAGELTIAPLDTAKISPVLLAGLRVGDLVRAMPSSLDAVAAAHVERTLDLRFSDIDEAYTLRIRRGVAEVHDGSPEQADFRVTTNSTLWKQILVRQRSAPVAYASGEIELEGSAIELARFLLLFRAPS